MKRRNKKDIEMQRYVLKQKAKEVCLCIVITFLFSLLVTKFNIWFNQDPGYRQTLAIENSVKASIRNLLSNNVAPYKISNKNSKNVMVHFSKSSFGNSSLISKWHVCEKFWKAIGYHFVILNGKITKRYRDSEFDGAIETGRGLNRWGIHCSRHNDAIGICFISRDGLITQRQYKSLKKLLEKLLVKYGNINLYQHANFNRRKPRLKIIGEI